METFPLNELLFKLLNNLAGHSIFFDNLVYFLAQDLGWIMILSILIYVYYASHRMLAVQNSLIAIAVAMTSLFIADVAKKIFIVPRPFMAIKGIHEIFVIGGFDSFPSGHAAFFGALAISIYLRDRKAGAFFLIGAVAIGLARVIAGIHYPLDILAGFLLGWLLNLAISYSAYKKQVNLSEVY
mgnify:CR=1 FL=1